MSNTAQQMKNARQKVKKAKRRLGKGLYTRTFFFVVLLLLHESFLMDILKGIKPRR